MAARIASLNCSNGGVPKRAVEQALVTTQGMEGDRQRDRRYHGGPSRALSLYSLELIEQLQLEGHPIAPGSTGENVTISGVDWREMVPRTRLFLGDVEVELTTFAAPCKTIRHSFMNEEFTRISQKLNPGWSRIYARVMAGGMVRVGESVRL